MVTRDQLESLSYGQTLHCCTKHECNKVEGPRGGVKENITRVCKSGMVKTWKTRPNDFHMPIKYGLRDSYWIDQDNAHMFHLPQDCAVSQF